MSRNFEGFKITQYDPDPGLLDYVQRTLEKVEHLEAESFVSFVQADDSKDGKTVEVVRVRPNSQVVLPRSMAGDSALVYWAGTWPDFKELDRNRNLQVVLPEGCALKVEFKGEKNARKSHVKIFKTF